MATVGQNIRIFRKRRELTQEQLGTLCGVSSGAISSYENGVTIPKRQAMEKIAKALDISAGKMIGGDQPPVPPSYGQGSRGTLIYVEIQEDL